MIRTIGLDITWFPICSSGSNAERPKLAAHNNHPANHMYPLSCKMIHFFLAVKLYANKRKVGSTKWQLL